jgi:hypothetical protein
MGSSTEVKGRGYLRREGVRSVLVKQGQLAGEDILANICDLLSKDLEYVSQ